MIISKTKLDGVLILEPKNFQDERGRFVKIFNKNDFTKISTDIIFDECFYSISNKNVIRGMHFQSPPHDHAKLVYVTNGSIIDVVLDIRKKSSTYGQYIQIKLSADNNQILYIPSGFAHGFLSLENNTLVNYLQTTMHSPKYEGGVNINSFNMKWSTKKPIVSERDKAFPSLDNFNTPFN